MNRFFVSVIFAILFYSSELHSVQRPKPAEYEVKAAFLYNFGKFVTWPPAGLSRNEFRICILGQDPFGATLDSIIAGETVEGRTVTVRRISTPSDSSSCQIVFISLSEDKRLKGILDVVGKTSALTVSEIPQFTQRGGMIGFILDGSKVRFEVNLTPGDGAGLMFSSELLRVAASVKRNPGA